MLRLSRPPRMGAPGAGLALSVALAGAVWAPTAGAATAPFVNAQTATLVRSHAAFRRPDPASPRVDFIHPRRPITRVRTALPVIDQAVGARGGSWLRVRLPGRPNGRTGWIIQGRAILSEMPWRLLVSTRTRHVVAYRGGRRVRSFRAIVGKPATPTPRGEFFVEEPVRLHPGAAGAPFALALSARSNVLQEFAGGPGQIALHGVRNIGGRLGTAVSHGCVRLSTQAIAWLIRRVPAGAPVTIR